MFTQNGICYNKNMKTKKLNPLILWAIIVDIVVIAVIVVINIINSKRNAIFDILIAPVDATITVDGVEFKNGAYKFFPGQHEVKIVADGFTTKTATVNLEENKTIKLYTFLVPENNEYIKYAYNPENITVLMKVGQGNQRVEEFIDDYNLQMALIEKLPYAYSDAEGRRFTILDITDDECKKIVCLSVTDISGEGNYSFAKQYLGEKGLNEQYYDLSYRRLQTEQE